MGTNRLDHVSDNVSTGNYVENRLTNPFDGER